MSKLFRIKLRDAHIKSGATPYRVAKDLKISRATVHKYTDEDEVISPYVPSVVVQLANYYGVDWRDPKIVEVIEEEDPQLINVA